MKIRFNCNSGANIHSNRRETFNPEDLGYTEDEWRALSDDEKFQVCDEWAQDRLEIFYEEIE